MEVGAFDGLRVLATVTMLEMSIVAPILEETDEVYLIDAKVVATKDA